MPDLSNHPNRGSGLLTVVLVAALALSSAAVQAQATAPDADPQVPTSGPDGCAADQDDCRPIFAPRFYTGVLIDTFAAEDLKRYLNEDQSSTVDNDYAAGFDVDYRLVGKNSDRQQLWLHIRTLYGVRSSEIDCSANSGNALCQDFDDTGSASERAIYTIAHADSLEAHLGLSWEFATLNSGSGAPARVYLGAETGFIAVEGHERAARQHRLSLGAMVSRGSFEGSLIEVGYGTSQVFTEDRGRMRLRGVVCWTLGQGVGGFADLEIDTDGGDGADSIRTLIGINMALSRLFGSSGS
ncbi:MAG: hypothetical protein GY856_14370 [bacterium]|nr:hypothetical protein [bacterium]